LGIGLVYTLLALLSYSTLGLFHKLADVKGCRPSAITVLLYFSSLVYLLIGSFGTLSVPGAPVTAKLLGVPFGMCSAIAILALQTALRFGNISTSWLAINLSAGVPAVASIVLYHEAISLRKVFALVLIAGAMVLLWQDRAIEERLAATAETQGSVR
jgi:EamA domain-containing membrane protein RarD